MHLLPLDSFSNDELGVTRGYDKQHSMYICLFCIYLHPYPGPKVVG